MRTTRFTTALLGALALLPLSTQAIEAQKPTFGQASTSPSEAPARIKLSGPRFGVTTFSGDVAEFRRSVGESIMMTQFGW